MLLIAIFSKKFWNLIIEKHVQQIPHEVKSVKSYNTFQLTNYCLPFVQTFSLLLRLSATEIKSIYFKKSVVCIAPITII